MTQRFGLLTLAIFAAAVQAQPAGRIDSVLVYPGGAVVERSVNVKNGQQQLKLDCLPARFDADSLQLSPAEGVSIGEISVQTLARAAAPECASSPLDTRIRELEDQRAALTAESASHDLTLNYLKAYGNGISPANPQITATAETLRRTGLEALRRQNALQRRVEEINRQLAPLTTERDRLVQLNPELRSITIRLQARRDAELRLSYRVNQAGWQPVYRAHLDTASGAVRLERLAQVGQSSGEDWSGVKLRLSTAQPRQTTGMAPPTPWTLDLLPPVSAESSRSRMAYAAAPVAAPVAMSERVAITGSRIESFDVSVFQGEFATEFEVPGRVDVAASGQRVSLALGSAPLKAQLMARTRPAAEAQAYLVAESERPQGVWPPGPMQLYRDGYFVGQGRLNLAEADWATRKLDLYFGRDELVRVSVEPEQRNTGSAGLLGTRTEKKLGNVYRIENQHQRRFAVQVLDASPVARHEDIKVETRLDPAPTNKAWRDQPGVLAWDFNLEPGATQRVRAEYLISYPKEARIEGMR